MNSAPRVCPDSFLFICALDCLPSALVSFAPFFPLIIETFLFVVLFSHASFFLSSCFPSCSHKDRLITQHRSAATSVDSRRLIYKGAESWSGSSPQTHFVFWGFFSPQKRTLSGCVFCLMLPQLVCLLQLAPLDLPDVVILALENQLVV